MLTKSDAATLHVTIYVVINDDFLVAVLHGFTSHKHDIVPSRIAGIVAQLVRRNEHLEADRNVRTSQPFVVSVVVNGAVCLPVDDVQFIAPVTIRLAAT